MRNVYSVEIEQLDRENPRGVPLMRENYNVTATTLEQAISKAKRLAKGNGFLKSRPLTVKSAERVITDLQS